jgi:aspartate kinase
LLLSYPVPISAAVCNKAINDQGAEPNHGAHRDEIRRHVDGRDRAHPPRRQHRQAPAGTRGTKSRWSSRPWRARPTGWSNFCREANPLYDPAEYDVVVAAGEQVTSGLLAITLQALGCKARSWLGWQLPIRTDDAHAKARIGDDRQARIARLDGGGEIAVIPGFQGLTDDNRVTTLGRGGSDTSAVAVAAAIKADRCDIYTDVDGVYTTDPRIVAKRAQAESVTYEEMLELASVGSKVLQTRSVGPRHEGRACACRCCPPSSTTTPPPPTASPAR